MIKNTAPLTIENGLAVLKLSRKFNGNLFPNQNVDRSKPNWKEKRALETRELKAYLKGHERFGPVDSEPFTHKQLCRHIVRQEYFYT